MTVEEEAWAIVNDARPVPDGCRELNEPFVRRIVALVRREVAKEALRESERVGALGERPV